MYKEWKFQDTENFVFAFLLDDIARKYYENTTEAQISWLNILFYFNSFFELSNSDYSNSLKNVWKFNKKWVNEIINDLKI